MGNQGMKLPGEVYTPGEVAALEAACSRRAPTGRRNRALIAVLHGGGLRISEALGTADKPGKPGKPGLRRGDVTRRDDMTGRIVIRDGKGSKSRSVTVDAATMAKLQDWMS